jgi:hypothetical protein
VEGKEEGIWRIREISFGKAAKESRCKPGKDSQIMQKLIMRILIFASRTIGCCFRILECIYEENESFTFI